jgi:hypothetical protein
MPAVQFKYKPGQVVNVWFPQDDRGPKPCPGLVLSCYDDFGPHYRIARLTKQNQTGRYVGMWIMKDSRHGKNMRIDMNSYINLDTIAELPEDMIKRGIGLCSCFDEIRQLAKDNGIAL